MYIRDLNFEFEELESSKVVDSLHAATATLYQDWLDINVQKILPDLFSSKEKKVLKSAEAFGKYYEQGEPRKSDLQTDLTPICQILYIAVQYISGRKAKKASSTQSQPEFRSGQCCSSGP